MDSEVVITSQEQTLWSHHIQCRENISSVALKKKKNKVK